MANTVEIKIKLEIENIFTKEYENFSYQLSISDNRSFPTRLLTLRGTFNKDWEATESITLNNASEVGKLSLRWFIYYQYRGETLLIKKGVSAKVIPLLNIALENSRERIPAKGFFDKATNKPVFIVKQNISRQCSHIDGAILIAEYITNEIKQNVKSQTAMLIRMNLESSQNPTPFSLNPEAEQAGTYGAALILWWKTVKTGSIWDHKHLIRDNPEFKKVAIHRPLEGNTPSKSYYHKYKDHDYYHDVWSNIHYGYVGLSVGFDKATLNKGSSHEQSNAGGNSDDPIDDTTTMNIGYTLYEKFGHDTESLTAQDILNVLEQATDDQLPESRQIHWCWHSENTVKIKR